MHAEAFAFVEDTARGLPIGRYVLEIGSLDVNGSVRGLFPMSNYVGIDIRPGPGVQIVADARDYDGGGQYDVVVSTECLEHEPEPGVVIECARRALRPGGLLIVTAASTGRKPHSCAGVEGVVPDGEHYANILPHQLEDLLSGWSDVRVTYHAAHGDVYAVALKR